MAKITAVNGVRFEVYVDRGAEWRWRMVAENNRIVAVSGEGFTRRLDAHRSVESIMAYLANPDNPMPLTRAKAIKG